MLKSNIVPSVLCSILGTAIVAGVMLTGCGKQNAGATNANIQFGTYTAFERVMNPALDLIQSLFEKPAMAATSSIFLCVHRVRFKTPSEIEAADPSTDPDSDDLSKDNRVGQQGWLSINTIGSFGNVHVSNPKVATRFRVDIDNHCVGHPAVQFTTSAGSFSSTSGFTMEFRAVDSVDLTKDSTISLGWQPINNALNALGAGSTDSQIISALSTRGTMQ